MTVLVLAEITNGELALDATSKTVNAVASLGEVTVLATTQAAGETAAKIAGVSKVLVAADAAYTNQLAEPMSDLVMSVAAGFEHIVAPATSNAKNILPRVAALLDVMIIPDVTAINDAQTFERPIYAGNAFQTVETSDKHKVLTIRTTSFEAAAEGGNAAVETLDAASSSSTSEWLEDQIVESDRPDLTSAGIVISGGRGMASKENFALVEALADKLGGAVGASRAAVDAGFAPNDLQVGQTGKVVSPDMYVAVGLSGAIQHLAGMKDSKVIVAINKDEEAPIFQVADFGIVGDLFDILPELTESV